MKNLINLASLFLVGLLTFPNAEARQEDPVTSEMLQAAGEDSMMVVVLHPENWPIAMKNLQSLFSGLPIQEIQPILDASSLEGALEAISKKLGFAWPEKDSGLDERRPIIAALFIPVMNEEVFVAGAVVPMEMEQGLPGYRHRILIPATDPQVLQRSLDQLLLGLKFEKNSAILPLGNPKGAELFQWPGAEGLLALIPENNRVRIEVLYEDMRLSFLRTRNQDKPKAKAQIRSIVEDMIKPAPSKEPLISSPALNYIKSSDDFLIYYIRAWKFRELACQINSIRVMSALAFADHSQREPLIAMAISEIGTGYLLMSPQGAEFDDWAFGWKLRSGTQLNLVASLTEQGRRVFEAGQSNTPNPLQPIGKDWMASGWIRLNLGAMLEAAMPPCILSHAKTKDEAIETIQECGQFCYWDLILRRPVGYLKPIWQHFAGESSVKFQLPSSVSFGFKRPQPGTDEKAMQLALAMFFLTNSNLEWLDPAIKIMQQEFANLGLRLNFSKESRQDQEIVFLGLNLNPQQVFGKTTDNAEAIGEVQIDLSSLTNSMWGTASSGMRLNSIQSRTFLAGRALVLTVSFGSDGQKPEIVAPDFSALQWESPGLKDGNTRGAQCTEQAMLTILSTLKAYARSGQDIQLLETGFDEAKTPLQCALGESDSRERAKQIQLQLASFLSKRKENNFDTQGALKVLAGVCQQGLTKACEQAKKVRAAPTIELAELSGECLQPSETTENLIRVSKGKEKTRIDHLNQAFSGQTIRPLLAVDRQAKFAKVAEVIRSLGDQKVSSVNLLLRKDRNQIAFIPVQTATTIEPDWVGTLSGPPIVVKIQQENIEIVGSGKTFPIQKQKPCARGIPCINIEEFAKFLQPVPITSELYVDASPSTPWGNVAPVLVAISCDRGIDSQPRVIHLGRVPMEIIKLAEAPVINRSADPTIIGPVSKDEIRRVIGSYNSQYKFCYEKELLKNPTLEGKIFIRFTIGSSGLVEQTELQSSTVNLPTFENCVLEVVKKMKFSPPRGGGIVIVNYPFLFKAAS